MIARVFPRQTNATPIDSYAFYDHPGFPAFLPKDITEVHVSVVFTEDLPKAEQLAKSWKGIAPVKIGGPATGYPGGDFVPGMYLKPGYVITSRGCPHNCWFCSVTKREGRIIRELPITDGYNVLDDNILRTSRHHFEAVIAMLKKQPRKAVFTGGLEAGALEPWQVDLLCDLKPDRMYFAYDQRQKYDALVEAGKMMHAAGFTHHHLYSYVLIGFPADTMSDAETRLFQAYRAGFMPMAMLYKEDGHIQSEEWKRFQRHFARPAIARQILKCGEKKMEAAR